MNFAHSQNNLILSLCVEPYSRPLAKCFFTPGIWLMSVSYVLCLIDRAYVNFKIFYTFLCKNCQDPLPPKTNIQTIIYIQKESQIIWEMHIKRTFLNQISYNLETFKFFKYVITLKNLKK